MAMCLQKFVNRISQINSLFIQGRFLTQCHVKIAEEQIIPTTLQNDCNKYIELSSEKNKTSGGNGFEHIYRKVHDQVRLGNHSIAYCQVNTTNADKSSPNPGGASEEQLAFIYEKLKEKLPLFFVTRFDFSIYHPNVIFENKIRQTRTIGVQSYFMQMSIVRLIGHFKYAYVTLEILKITKHPEDSTVKIRWQLTGITGGRLFFQLWKYKIWKYKEVIKQKEVWLDGFSTMYVGGDGAIYKHVLDNMMPDENHELIKKNEIKVPISGLGKAVLFVGLSSDIAPMILSSS